MTAPEKPDEDVTSDDPAEEETVLTTDDDAQRDDLTVQPGNS